MEDGSRAARTFVVLMASASLAFGTALIFQLVVYRGYGEPTLDETVAWFTGLGAWIAAMVLAWPVAGWLRGNRWLAMATALVAWPPCVIAAWLLVATAACAGWGPRGCAFS